MRNKFAKVSDPNKFVTESGDRYHTIYEPIVNPDGTISLVESGKEDIQAKIDSYKDQTDISFIVKKLAQGDFSVLSQKEPMYGDFTTMPKTYAEALQLTIDAEKRFYELPLETRNKFDNDYKQWFAQAGSDSWIERMGYKVTEGSGDIIVEDEKGDIVE